MFGNEKPLVETRKVAEVERLVVTPELASKLVMKAFQFSKENNFKRASDGTLGKEVQTAIDAMDIEDIVGLIAEEMASFAKDTERQFESLSEPTMQFWYMLGKLESYINNQHQ